MRKYLPLVIAFIVVVVLSFFSIAYAEESQPDTAKVTAWSTPGCSEANFEYIAYVRNTGNEVWQDSAKEMTIDGMVIYKEAFELLTKPFYREFGSSMVIVHVKAVSCGKVTTKQ